MGKIKYILCAICTALFAGACTDGNEWEVDSSYDRLFGTAESSFSIIPADHAAQAEASWKSTPNTTNYVIEVSTNPLSDDVPMGGEGSIVYGDGIEKITNTTCLLENLAPETEYYARIKSVGEGKESRWIYYDEGGTFKTNEEQILKVPTEITDSSVRISWEENCTVTSLRIFNDKGYDQVILFEKTELDNCSVVIRNLDAMTMYTVEIYNGERLRGTVSVMTEAGELFPVEVTDITVSSARFAWTGTAADGYAVVSDGTIPTTPQETLGEGSTSCEVNNLTDNTKYDFYIFNGGVIVGKVSFTTLRDFPAGYMRIDIASADEFVSKIESASGDVVFVVPEGVEWNLGKITVSNSNLANFIVWGEGTDKPSLKTALTIEGTYTRVEFYNLELSSDEDGSGWDKTYLINYQPDDDMNYSLDELVIEGCDILETGHAVRVKHSKGSIGGITINNCFFNGYKKYAVSLSDLKVDISNGVRITNSTFVNAEDGDYTFRTKSQACDIAVDYCTFYVTTTRDIYSVDNESSTFSVSNSLFGGSKEIKLCGDKCTLSKCENVYSSSDLKWKKEYGVKDTGLSTSELFPEMANGSYKAEANYAAYGDPNWN